jgi:hypothetical protein
MLKKDYKNLTDFVTSFEKLLKKQIAEKSEANNIYTFSKSPAECDIIARNFMQAPEFVSKVTTSDFHEDISSEAVQKVFIRRIYILLMAGSFMAYLKYARNAFNS